ncbi:MAG: hypothetical protein FK731_11225 [Asgard group archaeon]|nr:hypothetical protein [Asgard group archaeon]
MRRQKNILFFVIVILSSAFITTPFSDALLKIEINKEFSTNSIKNWTFMMYLCGDTHDPNITSTTDNTGNWVSKIVEGFIITLDWYFLLPGSEFNLNVIALLDYPYDSTTSSGVSKILKFEAGNVTELEVSISKDMGSYVTLMNFINYCKTNYPANNYALELNDHGAGYAGICYDFHGIHPYWNYSFGDCLTLEEVGKAIDYAGGVDVLFLDVCKGGSFELMWQLADKVHYAVAGESALLKITNYHPQDILYELSRDTGMTPLELAQIGFDYAVNPIRCEDLVWEPTVQWRTEALYDLTKFNYIPIVGVSFKEAFGNFAESLYDELLYNITRGRILFGEIRDQLIYDTVLFQSNSMMIDLTHFVEVILSNTSIFYYEDQISSAANELLIKLAEGPGNLIVAEDNIPYPHFQNMNGFSICFPNTVDYYQGYLYPNFYEYLDVSVETYWDEFIYLVNPPQQDYYTGPIPEFYEINLGPIDPSIDLHVFLKNEDLTQEPLHVGWGDVNIPDSSMGLEIGIEGAEYIDDMLFGTTTIKIPMTSIQSFVKNGNNPYLTIKVDASHSPSAVRPVNLTVTHMKDGDVIWEDNKIKEINIGEAFETDVFLDDTWTDFEVINYNETSKTGLFSNPNPIFHISIISTFTIMTFVIIKKRKK